MRKKIKYLIIGSGISGLTFAYLAKKDYHIIEKDSSYGGYCRTFYDENGFIWDYAGHFYHFKTDFFKNMFLELVPKSELIVKKKNTKIFYKNKLIDFPFQMNIHQLSKLEFIDCLYDLFNKEDKTEYTDFLDMLYSKFGKSITEKFLKPYNEKLYATDLKKLDTNAMGRFFPYADIKSIINNMKISSSNSYNSEFWYLKKGTQFFIDKIYERIDENKVSYNDEVKEINKDSKLVKTIQGNIYEYDVLINTISFNNFYNLVYPNNDFSRNLSFNKVLVFNLGFTALDNASKFNDVHWVYFPSKETNFYRVGFYSNILEQEKLSIYVEIGFSKDYKINIKSELKRTIDNLEQVGIINKNSKLINYNYVIMNPAYVHIEDKTNKQVLEEINKLSKDDIYTLGRYGKWTYNSMEDSMLWAKELFDFLEQENK